VGAVAALAVGCRDSVLAPARPTNSLAASASPLFSKSENNHERTILGTIELSPNGGIYHVGDFDIVLPAGAVCDPATTKYGPRHWDQDCVPANRVITVNVVAETRHDRVSIDFQPDIRFRPSAGWVIVQTQAYRGALTSSAVRQLSPSASFFNMFAILYAPSGGRQRINELRSTGDLSLVTHVNLSTGIVWRRVKHFSGYLIASGDKCDPTVVTDGTCISDDLGGSLGGATPFGAVVGDTLSFPTVVVDTLSVPTVVADTTVSIPTVVVDTVPKPVVDTIPKPVVDTIPKPVVDTIPKP
jgi:hypothetical protein